MRTTRLTIILAVVAMAAPSSAPGAATRGCSGGKGTVVARSAAALVKVQVLVDGDGGTTSVWRGCLRSGGRYLRFADGYEDFKGGEALSGFELAGRYAAFRRSNYSYSSGGSLSAGVVDLRTGEDVLSMGVADDREPRTLQELTVSTRGQLGLVLRDGQEDLIRVARPGGSSPRELDRGPAGAITGLAIVGGVARWRNNGAERFAAL